MDIAAPDHFEVHAGDETFSFTSVRRLPRPDVQKHLGLEHDLFGFELDLPMDAASIEELVSDLQIYCGATGAVAHMRLTTASRLVGSGQG